MRAEVGFRYGTPFRSHTQCRGLKSAGARWTRVDTELLMRAAPYLESTRGYSRPTTSTKRRRKDDPVGTTVILRYIYVGTGTTRRDTGGRDTVPRRAPPHRPAPRRQPCCRRSARSVGTGHRPLLTAEGAATPPHPGHGRRRKLYDPTFIKDAAAAAESS